LRRLLPPLRARDLNRSSAGSFAADDALLSTALGLVLPGGGACSLGHRACRVAHRWRARRADCLLGWWASRSLSVDLLCWLPECSTLPLILAGLVAASCSNPISGRTALWARRSCYLTFVCDRGAVNRAFRGREVAGGGDANCWPRRSCLAPPFCPEVILFAALSRWPPRRACLLACRAPARYPLCATLRPVPLRPSRLVLWLWGTQVRLIAKAVSCGSTL